MAVYCIVEAHENCHKSEVEWNFMMAVKETCPRGHKDYGPCYADTLKKVNAAFRDKLIANVYTIMLVMK